MTPVRTFVALGAAALLLAFAIGGNAAAETLSHGRFKSVQIHRPRGEVRHFALLLSGDGGWTSRLGAIAQALAADDTLVAGIDVAQLFGNLEADGASCVFPDGDLENLSHYIQAYYKLPTYFTPILIGHSAGASLAYAVLAQAPPGTFAGAISLSFCVDLDLHKPLCATEGLRFAPRVDGGGVRLAPAAQLHAPWVALHGRSDHVCPLPEAREFVAHSRGARFVELPDIDHNYARMSSWLPQFKAAYASIIASQPPGLPAPPETLENLPVIEVPATGESDLFAVLLSGDGGWAGLDKQVAAALAAHGIPVAGFDSLRYFWTPRTPEMVAQDVDRIVRYYAFNWHRKRAILIGYSQGADVLPFAVNRLPPSTRALVAHTALIGAGRTASFEFHVTNWLHEGGEGLPVRPEIDKLSSADTLCLYGDDDSDSICPVLNPANARVVELHGGHHFGGDYRPLAELILNHAAARPRAP
jgi:type IV secretory pathway VirJ component